MNYKLLLQIELEENKALREQIEFLNLKIKALEIKNKNLSSLNSNNASNSNSKTTIDIIEPENRNNIYNINIYSSSEFSINA